MIFRSTIRAAMIMAAFFILTPLVWSAPKQSAAKNAETQKDIIEKAFNLSLQKDRAQAMNILIAAIKQESARNVDTLELKKALEQISYVFYTERAQQTYELALSLKQTDAPQAQQKISEALRLEPDNRSLFIEMLRLLIAKGDCPSAVESATKERMRDSYDENLVLLQAQALACVGNWEGYVKAKEGLEIKKSGLYKFWLILELEHNFALKNSNKAKENLAALLKVDPKYPELHYWRWRAATGKEKELFAQRYLKECTNISSGVYRQYMTDVSLCRKVSEVEATRKNANNPT